MRVRHRLAASQHQRLSHLLSTTRAQTALYVVLALVICGTGFLGTLDHAHAAPRAGSPQIICCGTQVDFITNYQGFDGCSIAGTSTANMQTWWNDTYYAWVNVYIGGPNINHGCWRAPTASWISALKSQGWSFVPTYDGLAAPCQTNGSANMSYNTNTAYGQGVSDADTAGQEAKNLGFPQGTTIYEDMEWFDPSNTACYQAVNAYISGWVTEMGAKWGPSNIYESASDIPDLIQSSGSIPTDMWIAGGGCWSSSFNSNCTVWGNSIIPNGDFVYDQRLYQYTGGHNETYGGVTLNIDSDAANGVVEGVGGGDNNDGSEPGEGSSPSYDP